MQQCIVVYGLTRFYSFLCKANVTPDVVSTDAFVAYVLVHGHILVILIPDVVSTDTCSRCSSMRTHILHMQQMQQQCADTYTTRVADVVMCRHINTSNITTRRRLHRHRFVVPRHLYSIHVSRYYKSVSSTITTSTSSDTSIWTHTQYARLRLN